MNRPPRICPLCRLPVPGRRWRSVGPERYHVDCLTDDEHVDLCRLLRSGRPSGGRPVTARGVSSRQVVVRVSIGEAAQLDAETASAGVSAAEQFRRARFAAASPSGA